MGKKGIIALIKSMTGYGRAVETVNGREFTVELRSVNNRYLDCSVRLPRILTFGEEAVKQAVKACVSRCTNFRLIPKVIGAVCLKA